MRCVYLVGTDTAVKIGTARNVWRRMAELQIGSPVPLRLLVKFDGGLGTEAWLHERFRAHHTHGEWFSREGELERWIGAIRELMQRGVLTRARALLEAGARLQAAAPRPARSAWELSTARPAPGVVCLEARRLARKLRSG